MNFSVFFLTVVLSAVASTCHGMKFSSEHFAVWFDPFVSVHDATLSDAYTEIDLLTLIKRVSTKFKRIMIRGFRSHDFLNEHTVSKIPEAVAKFNKYYKRAGEPPLELSIVYSLHLPPASFFHPLSLPANEPSSYAATLGAANRANAIYSGTVKSVIINATVFDPSSPFINSLEPYQKQIRAMLRKSSTIPKLGVMLSNPICELPVLPELFSNVDSVLFSFMPKQRDVFNGVASFTKSFREFGEKCKTRITSAYGNGSKEVGFYTTWAGDTCGQPDCSSDRLVFWEEMNEFALEQESTVVLQQAFSTGNSSNGWWELEENSSYRSAYDYKFKELSDTDTIFLNRNFTSWFSKNRKTWADNLHSLVLHFNPGHPTWIPSNKSGNEWEMEELLHLQSFRRFDKLWLQMPALEKCAQGDFRCSVPLETAKLNANGRLSNERNVTMMKLWVLLEPSKSFSKNHYPKFQTAKTMLDASNAVFPATVDTVFLNFLASHSGGGNSNWNYDYFYPELTNGIKGLKTAIFANYTLGALLSLEGCGASRLDPLKLFVRSLANQLEIVIFEVRPTSLDFANGVDITLGGYFRRFQFCKEKLAKLVVELKVGFHMSWADMNDEQNVGNLVEFWVKASNWAKRTNTLVVISEAFDNLNGENIEERSRGWWRFIRNSTSSDVNDIFEDKGNVFDREMKVREGKTKSFQIASSPTNSSSSSPSHKVDRVVLTTNSRPYASSSQDSPAPIQLEVLQLPSVPHPHFKEVDLTQTYSQSYHMPSYSPTKKATQELSISSGDPKDSFPPTPTQLPPPPPPLINSSPHTLSITTQRGIQQASTDSFTGDEQENLQQRLATLDISPPQIPPHTTTTITTTTRGTSRPATTSQKVTHHQLTTSSFPANRSRVIRATSSTPHPLSTTLGVAPTSSTGGRDNGFLIAVIVSSVLGVTVVGLGGCFIAMFLTKSARRRQHRGPCLMIPTEVTREFFDGVPNLTPENSPLSFMTGSAYNASLEIRKNEFSLDETKRLGAGAFAVVFRGRVRRDRNEFDVAIKTTRSQCLSTSLVGILYEIKILDYIGKHVNIVNIIGAHTAQLSKGKVFLFTELCSFGSIESYFRNSFSSLTLRERVETPEEEDEEPCCPLLTEGLASDLVRWACQIASGMEFIASKNVVHADLATRNVLLTDDKTAKICDFGLSRRLYDYSTYFKSQEEPCPWRWMPPESLRRLEFNEKTDVWSFGVTLWELFSLGDKPFAGVVYTEDFASKLEEGYRLAKPRLDHNDWYSVMSMCWETDASKRPPFSSLTALLQTRTRGDFGIEISKFPPSRRFSTYEIQEVF